MPLRKPMLQIQSIDEENDDDDSDSDDAAEAVVVESNPSGTGGPEIKKKKSADSPDLNGMSSLTLGESKDSYDDKTSPPGTKRGRGPLRRQDSYEISKTMSFKQGDISSIQYKDLKRDHILGRGATAKVFLCTHVPTGQKVAVKELTAMASDDTRRMAVNELRMGHKHSAHADYLVHFIDAFFVDGKISIAMEFCDAGSLEDVYKASNPSVPWAPLAAMTLQMLRGIQYLHREMHQVHRDLKPANVMITSRGVAKLSDFGISKQLENTGSFAITQVGTSMYMAPERLKGEVYSYTSDVWSVGVIVLEGLLGEHPFDKYKSFMSLHKAICKEPAPPPPEDTPPEICEFLELCFRKDATGRTGRPPVRTLVSGAWLRDHATDPEAVTHQHLIAVGRVDQ